jgi:hypothetical protein
VGLLLRPVSFGEANDYVERLHRHHSRFPRWKFGIGVEDDQCVLRGVVMVTLPLARSLCDGWTLEVARCCTDGAKNAPSMLYSAAWRCAKNMGYRRMLTYTLESEPGTSLLAAGWRRTRTTDGLVGWNNRKGRSVGGGAGMVKIRWEPADSYKVERDALPSTESFRRDESPTLFDSLFDNVVTEPTEDV